MAHDDAPMFCATCGRMLGGDPADDPTGDDGQPICGECVRDRERVDDFVLIDLFDGELDGHLG
jgi:hypothetical protein